VDDSIVSLRALCIYNVTVFVSDCCIDQSRFDANFQKTPTNMGLLLYLNLFHLINMRPMGHITYLSNTGSYENTFRILIYISFPFAPPDPWNP
jgi:hypothetical protein